MSIKKKYKFYIAAALAVFIIAVLGIAYLSITLKSDLSSIKSVTSPAVHPLPTTLLYSVVSQQALFYSSGSSIAPYVGIGYTQTNLSRIYLNASLYSRPPPRNFYVLEVQNECINCGNVYTFVQDLEASLSSYGLINSTNFGNVSIGSVLSIQGNSILIVPSGLIPSQLLQDIPGSNLSVIQALLNKGTSIIYVGKNFSNSLIAGSIETPSSNLPSYLLTSPISTSAKSGYYFDSPTFSFDNGAMYGPISYENVSNGSIVAFSNYPDSWKNVSSEASDVARASSSLFWMPKFAYGFSNASIPTNRSSGSIGMVMDNYTYPYSGESSISRLDSGYGRVVAYNNYNYTKSPGSIYVYQYFRPDYSINGTVSVPTSMAPGYTTEGEFTIFTHSSAPIPLEPHLEVYTLNMSKVESITLPFSSQSGNFTFYKHVTFSLPPGGYVLSLESFSNAVYASGLFYIPPVSISVVSANFSTGEYKLRLYSAGVPLNGIPYTIRVNSLYPQNGTITNGTLYYTLPKGAPEIYGNLGFNISMLSSNFHYVVVNKPISITISSKYVVLAIVAVMVLVLVTVVKAPDRDEFYIDVPGLQKTEKTPIKLNPTDVISSFDKLNLKYKWRYMPLSREEVRSAIASSIRYGSLPVSLTFNNVNILIDQLSNAKMIESADDLYAPKQWMEKSGHDIEYLATFKKLRVYLVTHGYLFTDLDASDSADMVITMHGERGRVVIYSKTSKFTSIQPVTGSKTFIAFLNAEKLEEFRDKLSRLYTPEADKLRMYIDSGMIIPISADNPSEIVL